MQTKHSLEMNRSLRGHELSQITFLTRFTFTCLPMFLVATSLWFVSVSLLVYYDYKKRERLGTAEALLNRCERNEADSRHTHLPKQRPLRTLDELLTWIPKDTRDEWRKARSLQRKNTIESKFNRRLLLVCHDMQGGYLDDAFIFGTDNVNAYTPTYFTLCDTFVYFSHEFVTIPPPAFVNAAHAHQCECLGTLITEWDEGKALCTAMLSCDNVWKQCIHQLVALCDVYGFDGWLINVENGLTPALAANLLRFVDALRCAMPTRTVLCYDSIALPSGALSWQNGVTERNVAFLHSADGFFLNYGWSGAEHLRQSVNIAGNDVRYRIFAGVDVFGRQTIGGGGFNVGVALQCVCEADVSVALFAPGWTHECFDASERAYAARRVWSEVHKYMDCRRLTHLPLHTVFESGTASRFFWHGREMNCRRTTHNLSLQTIQPLLCDKKSSKLRGELCHDLAFLGGSSIRWRGAVSMQSDANQLSDQTLFETHIVGEDFLYVTFTYTVDVAERHSSLALRLVFANDDETVVLTDTAHRFDVHSGKSVRLRPFKVDSFATDADSREFPSWRRVHFKVGCVDRTLVRVDVVLAPLVDVVFKNDECLVCGVHVDEPHRFLARLGEVRIGSDRHVAATRNASIEVDMDGGSGGVCKPTDVCVCPYTSKVYATFDFTDLVHDDDLFTFQYVLIGREKKERVVVARTHLKKWRGVFESISELPTRLEVYKF